MTDAREQGLQVFRELLPGVVPDGDVDLRDGTFGDELFEIAINNVFGRLWGRDGLSRRERSLVTLGILIKGVSRINRSRCKASAETLSGINRSRNVKHQPRSYRLVEPPRRIELLTCSLRVSRSTD